MEEHNTEVLSGYMGAIAAAAAQEKQPLLMILSGPEKGATLKLGPGNWTLGRSEGHSDLVVNGRGISRAHARIEVGLEETWVHDLQSTNGTFVNQIRVEKSKLSPGDVLGLGPDVKMRLDYSDSTTAEVYSDLYKGANLDSLTSLLNRRAFLARLREDRSAGRRHGYTSCLALIDVDRFKSVNDTYGHPAGDAVLKELARTLSECMRTEDVVGRYGGEEFILLLSHTDLSGAEVVLERLRLTVARRPVTVPTPEGERQINITISIGLTRLQGEQDEEYSIQEADKALYQAKESGRNRICRAASLH